MYQIIALYQTPFTHRRCLTQEELNLPHFPELAREERELGSEPGLV